MAPQMTDEWLALENAQGGRNVLNGTSEQMVEQFNALVTALAETMPAPDPTVTRTETNIAGVRCVVFRPTEGVQPGQLLPVGIYTHGGGFIMGSPETEALICEVVAKNTPSVVVSVDYRLAPQHKHPAALEDSLKVYEAVWKESDSYGGDRDKFYSMGGSAGGGLALSVAHKLVSNPSTKNHIKGCVALVPISLHPDNVPAEYKSSYTAYQDNAKDVPVIDKASMDEFYRAAGADPNDADNFTALAKDNHKNFPPTYFAACEADPLRDDSIVMEKALSSAGVKTKLDMYKGLPHYFWIFPGIPEAQQFVGNLLGGVQFVLS